ncbi:serine protease [Sinorhizobium meliloti]|uniref:AAA family ATPase n=1 Tax=Rhizobium meliloti TaxID=382 RepID=UPI000FD26371|nr:AAA family ATPase [Sinorhizobium meliloti]RVI11975.1 serine protease [Sinorhizobium meliloti]RVN79988.1 serine protease [Sinorhizobium meliloti]RVO11728.1 serine protease [Sinorhizobium meliloti]
MIRLSAQRQQEFANALAEAFDPKFLESLLASRLDLKVREIVSPQLPYQEQVGAIIRHAAQIGRLEDLLRVTYEANPRSGTLQSLNEAVGLLPATDNLVELVRDKLGPNQVGQWAIGLAEVRQQVCVVSGAGGRTGICGTGFLVGPDQVMTHIVVAPLGPDGRFSAPGGAPVVSFARLTGPSSAPYTVRPDPVFVSRSGLVVMQLDREAGREIQVGGALTQSRGRGWIVPHGPAVSAAGTAVIIVQHHQDQDVRVAIDTEGLVSTAGGMLRYRTATLSGATGAPCFDIEWRLLGVHLQSSVNEDVNEGIPIAAFVEQLHEQHCRWDLTSGITRDPAFASHGTHSGELDDRVEQFEFTADTADDVWSDDADADSCDEDRWAWAEAAAVTSTYDPEKLAPTEPASDHARACVIIESTPVSLADGSRVWTLPDRIRVPALERLSKRKALQQARENNPGTTSDPVNVALGALIAGDPVSLADRQDPARLRSILQAASWLSRTKLQLPSLAGLHADLERAKLLAPFRHLTRGFFAGRDAELARLIAYVEGPDATAEPGPLLVHGPGGMGKSALIAHFILDYSGRDPTRLDIERPFIYLDFDRPELDARDHLCILLAIARQISPQLSSVRQQLDGLLEVWEGRRRQTRRTKRGRRTRQPTLALYPSQVDDLLDELAAILTSAQASPTARIPVIFDTLEEVQYATPDAMPLLVDLIGRLQGMVPSLRPILAGRVEIEDVHLDQLPLQPLPKAAAEALLGNHLPPTLASKSELIERMIRVVGGNPLSLRLAADMLRREADEGNEELREEDLWQRIGDAIVQGQLYERIAEHLHDDAVKQIAIPGLVLRYITSDLIEDVLAGPCQLDVTQAGAAEELFEKLASETALVRQGQDTDRLVIRPDLRRTVLEGFRKDRGSAERRRQIHAAAIAYFAQRPGPENRAEEIYHRLWLDEEPDEIDARWLTGVEPMLRNAVEELEGRARLYLANRVGVSAGEVTASATQVEWERYAEKRAGDLLQLGLAQAALAVLGGRSERLPASRLFLLESIAHSALGEHAEAESLANTAVSAARVSMNSEDIEAALDQLVQARRQLGDTDGVLQALAELGNLGEALGDDLIQVEANTAALESIMTPDSSSQGFSDTAVRAFSRLPDELIVRAPELARRLAAQVGGEYPSLLQRVVRLVGIGPLDAATAVDLGHVLQGWAYEDPDIQPFLPKAPASVADVANATQYLVGRHEINRETARSLSNWMRPLVSGKTTLAARQDSLPV